MEGLQPITELYLSEHVFVTAVLKCKLWNNWAFYIPTAFLTYYAADKFYIVGTVSLQMEKFHLCSV
jgi:hypothetical protein